MIGSLPTPYREDYIFVSWYYDKDRTKTRFCKRSDHKRYYSVCRIRIAGTTESRRKCEFCKCKGVAPDFQIQVTTTDGSMDAASVRAAIEATNLTDPKQTDIIDITGGSGTFTISGKDPVTANGEMDPKQGFAEGCTYRIALNDNRLNFTDQSETAREYNFTTAKEEVLNTNLKDGMIFIPAEDVSNITNEGESVATLSLALYEAEKDGTLAPANLTEGEFDYTKEHLKLAILSQSIMVSDRMKNTGYIR